MLYIIILIYHIIYNVYHIDCLTLNFVMVGPVGAQWSDSQFCHGWTGWGPVIWLSILSWLDRLGLSDLTQFCHGWTGWGPVIWLSILSWLDRLGPSDTYNSSTWVLDWAPVFGTHHFFLPKKRLWKSQFFPKKTTKKAHVLVQSSGTFWLGLF
jgi:hypothetical protein